MTGPSQHAGTAPVFKPLKSRSMVFGIGIPELFTILLVTALGAGAFFAVGSWTHVADVPIAQSEALARYAELSSLKDSVARAQALFAATGAESAAEVDLSAADAEAYRRAVGLGVTADSTREELLALVPDTVEQALPVVPGPLRLLLLIVLPFFLSVGLLIEYSHGTSALKDLRRAVKNARRQHVYLSQPRLYIDKETPDVKTA